MSDQVSDLLKAALALPEAEREWLANELLDSLSPLSDDERDAAWLAELERRAAESAKDPSRPIPWSEARRMMFL